MPYFGVLNVTKEGFVLTEHAPDMSPEDVVKATGAPVKVSPEVRPMSF